MDNDLLDLPAELQVPEEEEDAEEDAERLESAALHSATSIMRMAEEAELSLEGVEQEAATLRAKQEEMEFFQLTVDGEIVTESEILASVIELEDLHDNT